jgi:hypothetical protein
MSIQWVILAYGFAALLALALLYLSGPKAWYWHVLSGAAALAIGLMPIPAQWNTPQTGLIVGFFFVFLFVWAVAAPFLRGRRR